MVSKDQTIGGIILIVCVVIAIFYLVTLFWPRWLSAIGVNFGSTSSEIADNEASIRFWVIAIPVFLAFIAIMAIGAWIGWTMATTPPPKPIEEITSEIEEKKEEEKAEEKTAEEATTEAEEEKKPERKKKSGK